MDDAPPPWSALESAGLLAWPRPCPVRPGYKGAACGCDALSGAAAWRGPGALRVPAELQLRPSDPCALAARLARARPGVRPGAPPGDVSRAARLLLACL